MNHYFGNQGDGFLYAGNLWMHGYAMLASVSMPAASSSAGTVGYADAFRKQLVAVLQSVDEQGEVRFGFRHPGKAFPELGLQALIAVEADTGKVLNLNGTTATASIYANQSGTDPVVLNVAVTCPANAPRVGGRSSPRRSSPA